MTKHTPGPWTLNRVDFDNGEDAGTHDSDILAPNGSPIGLVFSTHTAGGAANAALIAAAPAMLEALKHAAEWFAREGLDGGPDHRIVRAAIDAAEGRTHVA